MPTTYRIHQYLPDSAKSSITDVDLSTWFLPVGYSDYTTDEDYTLMDAREHKAEMIEDGYKDLVVVKTEWSIVG